MNKAKAVPPRLSAGIAARELRMARLPAVGKPLLPIAARPATCGQGPQVVGEKLA